MLIYYGCSIGGRNLKSHSILIEIIVKQLISASIDHLILSWSNVCQVVNFYSFFFDPKNKGIQNIKHLNNLGTSKYDPSSCPIQMKSYKSFTLKYLIYTAHSTQQIYDYNKNIKSCYANWRAIFEVIDERNKFSEFGYARL